MHRSYRMYRGTAPGTASNLESRYCARACMQCSTGHRASAVERHVEFGIWEIGASTSGLTDGTHGIVLWFLVGTAFLPEEVDAGVWPMGQLLSGVRLRLQMVAYAVCNTETQACIRWEILDRVGR